MSRFMPLPMMARVAQSDRLPSNMQRDVALAVWTRAVLLEDAEIANSVAPIVARHFPQFGAGWKAYQGAATPQQKKMESALLLLRLPAASPWPIPGSVTLTCATESGSYATTLVVACGLRRSTGGRRTGRCPALRAIVPFRCNWPRRHSSRARIATARAMRSARLRQLPGAPAYLGAIILGLGQRAAARSAGARGAPPRGAGNTIRTKRIARRRRQPTCSCTIAIAAIPGRRKHPSGFHHPTENKDGRVLAVVQTW